MYVVFVPINLFQLRNFALCYKLTIFVYCFRQFYEQEAEYYCMPDATIRIGQYCMAPYSGEWHRARITAVHNLIDVQVRLKI
jgi:hypothetical protein